MHGAPSPVVSVIVAAWNAEATLARCLDSALGQAGVDIEVIVVDDASTDATAKVAGGYAARDSRLRLLRQPRNLGPAAARNRAIAAARAPWITPLDADDFMAPGRLSTLLDIARQERADLVADDILKQDEAGEGRERARLFGRAPVGRQRLSPEAFIRGNLGSARIGRRELGFVKPLVSADFLRRHGLRYADLRLGEDYVLYAEALICGAKFVLTDPAGYVATVRAESLSGRHPTGVHAALVAEDRRLMKLPGVTPSTRRALLRHMREHQRKGAWRRLIDRVRERDFAAAAACFAGPPHVGLDLSRRLLGEAAARTGRRAARLFGRGPVPAPPGPRSDTGDAGPRQDARAAGARGGAAKGDVRGDARRRRAASPGPEDVIVVVPALNEARTIEPCLRSLIESDSFARQVQVVVADGGSDDGTQQVVRRLAGTEFPNVRLIPNPDRLQAAAVNRAVARQTRDTHRILVRCDGHSEYPPGYIRGVAETLSARPEAASVTTVMDACGRDAFQRAAAWVSDTPIGSGGSGHRGGTRSGWVDHGHHAGFCLDWFRRIGGYDPAFSHNEDAEFDYRLTQAGGRVWLEGGLRLRYWARSSLRALWRQYLNYGRGRARTWRKHRMPLRPRQMAPVVHVMLTAACLVLAPVLPALLLYPLSYATVLAAASLACAADLRAVGGLWAGPAAAAMHHAWGLGFLRELLAPGPALPLGRAA